MSGRVILGLRALAVMVVAVLGGAGPGSAQSPASVDESGRLESIEIRIANPSPDAALNSRVIDRIRAGLGVFTGDHFSRTIAEFNLAKARRASPITQTTLQVSPGPTGGVSVTIIATLGSAAATAAGRGALISGTISDLPVLIDRDGTFVKALLEGVSMYYGNKNAW